MYILHLSDLHFGTNEDANNWHSQLAHDLRQLLPLNLIIIDVFQLKVKQWIPKRPIEK